VGQNGCKPRGCEQAVFSPEPDEKRDKKDKQDGMHELPVAQEVKEMGSCLVAHAAAEKEKKGVWDKIEVRED